MGCSPSAYPTNQDRATDPLAQGGRFDDSKVSSRYSRTRSSISTSEGQEEVNESSSSSDHRRRRRNSLGKKSNSRDRRGSFEQKGFSRQRHPDDSKDKPCANQDMKRKDTPAALGISGRHSVKSSVSQLTSSQIDFFRMLDEKIAQGQDYESETEISVTRSTTNAVDLMYKSEVRTQSL